MQVRTSLLWLCILEMASPKVAVVGAGLIGLSTALCITENCPSCSVTVLSDQFSPNTMSDVAAGMLIPHTYPGSFKLGQHCPWHLMQLCPGVQQCLEAQEENCLDLCSLSVPNPWHSFVCISSLHNSSLHMWFCSHADTPIHRQKQWFKETFTYLFAISNSAEASEAGIHLVSG